MRRILSGLQPGHPRRKKEGKIEIVRHDPLRKAEIVRLGLNWALPSINVVMLQPRGRGLRRFV